ncbi:DNA repair protein RecN [Lysobacter helvus]|uniref:DNA repair protein RecN n=2 Tax=Lysobacteraceae TaxID=32033 RepID=A0ABN6FY55_9GAMM|nr:MULTISPECIES: DNA repair protein RecN [Lysobacter]BCT93869.1 DNA repair protein RecN [Lysobacter caseinilyticus]BCT97025.1 DNA repair protein RecN [Lysobacter helvus]
MLTHLAIKDFAVVRAAELDFAAGLTVISGETGAGKSLLVDALGFLSGARADSGVVRHGAERAELVAVFDLSDAPAAAAWLQEQDLDDTDAGATCQLRRTLRADGGSKAWINGRPATIAQVAELAGRLVEIHGQHEHQALMARGSQLALLDAFGRHAPLQAQVQAAARTWAALVRERDALSQRGDPGDRIAFLEHQLQELQRDALEPAAFADLVAAHRRHAHAAGLIEACDAAAARLGGEDGPALGRQLQQMRNDLARQAEHEPRLLEIDAMLDTAAIQLDEAASLLERVRADLDLDPTAFDDLDRKLTRLHDLARKHRIAPEGLAAQRDALVAELESLRGAEDRVRALDGEIESARLAWAKHAATLTKARTQAAKSLASSTTTLIGELGMGGGAFSVSIEPNPAADPDPQGAERIEFLVAANPGQPARALRKVASGGELSRISLAIEVAALGLDAVPTMVFDEVDSGIGGAVADIVGQKLRALGAKRQVLCVTHLPQVAAQGNAHYRVSKAASDGMTQSAVRQLEAKDREEELARMLGGVEVSKEARAAARRLLADVG